MMRLKAVGRLSFGSVLLAVMAGSHGVAADPTANSARVVVLGTGNPSADPERSGPAVAVVVNGRAYLVDCGPGVVRRAAAAEKNGIAALKARELNIVFITHLHSDHTLGYPDLIFSPWVLGRKAPLEAFGPSGLVAMTGHKEYFRTFHTSPAELGDIARRARPRLLVVYHQSLEGLPESDLVDQIGREYSGKWVSAKDLGVY